MNVIQSLGPNCRRNSVLSLDGAVSTFQDVNDESEGVVLGYTSVNSLVSKLLRQSPTFSFAAHFRGLTGSCVNGTSPLSTISSLPHMVYLLTVL